jgi:hypothetical protein
MGELSKSPKFRTEHVRATCKILQTLLRIHGMADTVRYLQYAAEDEAKELSGESNPVKDINKAARLLKAADKLDTPFQEIKHDIQV